MAMPKDIQDTVELYKAKVANNPNFSDEYKKSVINALNIASLATNGITVEEKIQKMTEAIYYLGVSQITQMIDVNNLFYKLTDAHCEKCQAMKHANQVKEEERNKKIIEDWKAANGIVDDDARVEEPLTWQDVVKQMLIKPYIYIVGCIMIISPYGVEIVKTILEFMNK